MPGDARLQFSPPTLQGFHYRAELHLRPALEVRSACPGRLVQIDFSS